MMNPVNYYIPRKSVTIQLFIILWALKISDATLWVGSCQNPPVVQKFETEKFFNNTWYEIQSYGNELFQGFGTCSGMASRVTENNQIVLKTYSYQPILQKYVTIDGISNTQSGVNAQGALSMTFNQYGGLFQAAYDVRIIDTDYTNFAVVYLCQQRLFIKSEMAYVLSRTRSFPDYQTSIKISSALYMIGLALADLRRSVNTNCGSNEPVV